MTELRNWGWTQNDLSSLAESLTAVLLEEWGGPRSPLALKYINETIIPDLVHCFCCNADLLTNSTYAEIIQWKLKNQFANPSAVVEDLAKDLLLPAQKIIKRPQITDPKEPWRRIFRLWISGESLPNIAERTGYPLDYLDLLILRLKRLEAFTSSTRASLLECKQNAELRDYGFEQLSFLYQFQTAVSGEPLYKERLILEQVIWDLGMPLMVPDLVTLLEIIHTHEGRLDEQSLISAMSEAAGMWGSGIGASGGDQRVNLFSCVIDGLISLHYIQKNKAGKLALSEKSAQIIAGFLLPKLGEQLKRAVEIEDLELAKGILLGQNEAVLIHLIDWVVTEFNNEQGFEILSNIYQKVSRRVDIHLIKAFAKLPTAFDLLIRCLGDNDSLIRARACDALSQMGNGSAAVSLLQLLKDPVVGVRELAVEALGEVGDSSTIECISRVSEDYGESVNIREKARKAILKIESRRRN
ncbi:HEAT repeat domain-containing protein [Desulfosporosinus meridiei]|uniref:HEAT repeat protein n=1 Tax=Desulfosporosinus meridiei (strain ATCC BAA-275 / DSM 13257 / KCTC 12902 / NCIMB 13706 / S10) TaxID=768704 RepID=J7J243_DESMD|nr:HEAT repeat domain-containing protein [Desulfosporosinus meridiei]AFQ45041.1 HEAT repeat protein [Desulfosporosinus meridiei DSM 13257]